MRNKSGFADHSLTTADAIRFLENAFRNIELPPLDDDDVEDVRLALQGFRAGRVA